jgi:hypothetical protein
MRASLSLALVLACSLALFAACGKKQASTPTATPQAVATTPAATSTPARTATAGAAGAAAAIAQLAALNGLRCVGSWKNTTFGSTGAFATSLETGGGGGTLHFEVGGNVFGAQGGVFDAPFVLQDGKITTEAHSPIFGHLSTHIGLDGTADGELSEIPALGPKSKATASDYSFRDNKLHFALKIDFGDGRPPANSVVDAACSKR